jgi:hypothetical protein
VNLGARFRSRAAVAAAVLLLSSVAAARGQTPNLLVDVALVGTARHAVVEAILTADSTLLLPAAAVHALLGLPAPASTWTTPAAIARAFPTVTVEWRPRELRLLVDDPLGVLPASRAIVDARQRHARGAAYVARSGPFAAFAADDSGRSAIDAGYSWRGRIAVTGRHSSTRGAAWAVSLAPAPSLFVSYVGGDRSPPMATARVAAGPAWAFATWTPGRWSVDGLVTVGRVSLFASSRDAFAVTINAAPVGVQVGRQGSRTTARLTYGPLMPSPFSVPVVP